MLDMLLSVNLLNLLQCFLIELLLLPGTLHLLSEQTFLKVDDLGFLFLLCGICLAE